MSTGVLLLSMAACAASTPAAAETAADTNTEAVTGVEDGVLTVGMECAYAPSNWQESAATDTNVPVENVIYVLKCIRNIMSCKQL